MINRRPSRERFTVISNVPIRDERLSWKARGLLTYLLSMPDNWNVVVGHLVNQAPDGKASVMSALTELERAGYVERQRRQGGDGRFDGMDCVINEEPLSQPTNRKSDNGASTNRLSASGKPANGKSDTKKYLDLSKTEKQEHLPIADAKGFDAWFEQSLWPNVARKTAKTAAKRVLKAALDAKKLTREEAVQAAFNHEQLTRGTERAKIMYPSTMFGRDERWRDYLDGSPELTARRPATALDLETRVNAAWSDLVRAFDGAEPTSDTIKVMLGFQTLTTYRRMQERDVREIIRQIELGGQK